MLGAWEGWQLALPPISLARALARCSRSAVERTAYPHARIRLASLPPAQSTANCGAFTERAVGDWLKAGGRRIDAGSFPLAARARASSRSAATARNAPRAFLRHLAASFPLAPSAAANSYGSQISVGKAMAASGVPRSDIFLLSKVGPSQPLGYNDSLAQFEIIKQEMGVT